MPREPAYDTEQKSARIDLKPQFLLQRCLVGCPLFKMLDREALGKRRIGRRIPNARIDAVEDAAQIRSTAAQEPGEPHAALFRADLLGIGWRHRRHAACHGETGLQIPIMP